MDSNSKEFQIRLVLDYIYRSFMHHSIWFSEINHQYGRDKARELLKVYYDRIYDIHLNRLSKVLGFDMISGVPEPLLEMEDEKFAKLKEAVAINWLATDGVWFQAVEFDKGLFDAKRINDSCWAQFSPYEAYSIQRLLGLPPNPGLEGLKLALQYRLYAAVNKQTVIEESPTSFVFQMNECRVQVARKRKGLEDYPCKSGGLIEYTSFAEAIDSRIITECISCPPDKHPEEYYCAWRFSLRET